MDLQASLNLYASMEIENTTANITLDDFLKMARFELKDIMEDLTSYKIHIFLQTYIPPIFIVMGVIGNMLSCCVFRRYLSKTPIYQYLTVLAVVDTFILAVGQSRLWLKQIGLIDILDLSDFSCKLMTFICYVSSEMGAWVIVGVTIDRYIAVCKPLKTKNKFLKKKLKWLLFLICVIIFIINIHFFWTVELVDKKRNDSMDASYICEMSPNHSVLIANIWPWIDISIYSIIPGLFIFTLNGRMIKKMYEASRRRSVIGNQNPQTIMRERSQNKKMTILFLLVSFMFLLTTLPFTIVIIFTAFFKAEHHNEEDIANFILARTVTEILMYLNHSVNFLLYCASGAQFRNHLRSLFCKTKLKPVMPMGNGKRKSLDIISFSIAKTNYQEHNKKETYVSCM